MRGVSYWFHPGEASPSSSASSSSSSNPTAAAAASTLAATEDDRSLELLAAASPHPEALPPSASASASTANGGEEAGDANSPDGSETPLVFVHGVGLGPLPYLGFIRRLAGSRAPTIVLELPFVSQRISSGEIAIPPISPAVAPNPTPLISP